MRGARTPLILIAMVTAAALACAPAPQQPQAETRVQAPPAAGPAEGRVDGPPATGTAETRPAPRPAAHRSDLPRATMPDGTVLALELALTPEEITQGLMFRPTLAEDHGMLFVFPQPRYPSFWMLNTWIPLDMVFLDASGAVIEVKENARPCPAEPCPKYVPGEPALAVLEVNAGAAAKLGLSKGARIRVDNVSGFPAPQPSE